MTTPPTRPPDPILLDGLPSGPVEALLDDLLEALAAAVELAFAAVLVWRDGALHLRRLAGPSGHCVTRPPTATRPSAAAADLPLLGRIRAGETLALGPGQLGVAHLDHELGVAEDTRDRSRILAPIPRLEEAPGVLELTLAEGEPISQTRLAFAASIGRALGQLFDLEARLRRLDQDRARLAGANRRHTDDLLGGIALADLLEAAPTRSLQRLRRRTRRVARADLPVLIRGERGSGASLLARLLHDWSPRAAQPLLVIQPAHWSPGELARELLGPTGADGDASVGRPARIALAHAGTLYIDGVEALPPGVQRALVDLIEALDEEAHTRPTASNFRLVASTAAPLEALVEQAQFDADLLGYLAVVELEMPRLRDLRDELPELAQAWLDVLARRCGAGPWTLTDATAKALRTHDWPGNFTQLGDLLQRATRHTPAGPLELNLAHLRPPEVEHAPDAFRVEGLPTLEVVERRYIEAVLKRTGGKVYGAGGAAELLGLKPTTLQSRMVRLDVSRPARDRRKRPVRSKS